MVAHRSPKPLVWVRILLPLPIKARKLRALFFYFRNIISYTLKRRSIIHIKTNFILFILIFTIFYSTYSIIYEDLQAKAIESEEEQFEDLDSINNQSYFSSSIQDNFFWPIPGFTHISSYFGKRTSPATSASTFHSGIDVPAPEGTGLYSILNGIVSYVGFKGANGHTIIISSGKYNIIYGHVSPNYIISKDQEIHKGDLIGFVGPKYINDIINNPYSDSKGNPTNGATTGPHLHLSIKKDGKAVNPLNYFNFK